jgi:hypothetical protein
MNKADIFKLVMGIVGVITILGATAFELPVYSNTQNLGEVFINGGMIWIPFCLLTAVALAVFTGNNWTHGLLIGLVAGVFSMPLAVSWINRLGLENEVYTERLTYLGMDARHKNRGIQKNIIPEPDEYHVFMGDENEPLRLIVPPDDFWHDTEVGSELELKWLPGRLGGRVFKGVEQNGRFPSREK